MISKTIIINVVKYRDSVPNGKRKTKPACPNIHFLLKAERLSNGKPFTTEKVRSLIAKFTINMLDGVRKDLSLKNHREKYIFKKHLWTFEMKFLCQIFNPFPNKPWFLRVCSTSLLKTLWGKEEIARNEQFLLFPTVFSTDLENFLSFSSYI